MKSVIGSRFAPLFVIALLLAGCGHRTTLPPATIRSPATPPPPMREFRAAWVASVANIDWPSQPGLPPSQQQRELIAILDHAVRLKLNAIILQVRPACDALYASPLEPWSEYLTGKMGQPPQPFYDPLAFAVEQAHRRGLELHAWFNPFRARHANASSTASPNHVSRTRPHWVRKYGAQLWLDPSDNEAQHHSLNVILDVVNRYDVDGVHLDDYFYPYKEKDRSGKLADFPDDKSWNQYRTAGGQLDRPHWRRQHIDRFIQTLYSRVKAAKPWVKVGISPFGIWRPGHPPQIVGLDAYNDLYADSRKWLAHGWLDYVAPQLYWDIAPPAQSYPVLLRWWADQNTLRRHLWPGISSARIGPARPATEIANQIRLRRHEPRSTGHIFWNVSSLTKNRGGIADLLAQELHAQPALIPASSWLDKTAPARPKLHVNPNGTQEQTIFEWEPAGSEPSWLWILQVRSGSTWSTAILPGHLRSRTLAQLRLAQLPDAVAITAVDRSGNISIPSVQELSRTKPVLSLHLER